MNELQVMTANNITLQGSFSPDLYESFIEYLDASPKTIETYKRAIRQLVKYFMDNGITSPRREDVVAYREELKATGHKPTTIQNYLTAAKLFFKWTASTGKYPNIADHLKGMKLDKDHKKDYLTSTQVKDVLDRIERGSLKGKRDYAIVRLMVTAGLRTIEVIRADVGDLRTLGDGTVIYIQGKGHTEKAEYVKVPPLAEKAVRDYLTARKETDPAAPLFVSTSNNNAGKRLTTRAISGIVKDRLKGAGFNSERITAHSLRHTAVTLALLQGKPLEEAQQFARHANISTTMVYNHALDKAKNSCSNAIEAAIS